MYDLILKNGFVVDPLNHVEGNYDLGIQNGQICEIDAEISKKSKRYLDLRNKIIIPGIIDMHTHVRTTLGHPHAQRMLALAGVCTTLDMGGPMDNILDSVSTSGSGINVAVLEAVASDSLISSTSSIKERKSFIERALNKGCIGIKLLGGHYPMENSLCSEYIELCSSTNAWVHVGNKQHGSNIEGFRDAIEASQGKFLHIAHVNSYCRGQIDDEITESQEALSLLEKNPNIFSESYLSPLNSTIIAISNGKPISRVASVCLQTLGYEPSYSGMEKAILDGKLGVLSNNGKLGCLLTGTKGVESWKNAKTITNGSFAINPAASRFLLATVKRQDGSFAVDCFSTDGGACPRNVIVENGLLLVKFGALSLKEFVIKSSLNGAKALGLPKKGHLGIGADADITVIDMKKEKAITTVVGGSIIMDSGNLLGKGTCFICDERGLNHLKSKGVKTYLKEPLDLKEIENRYHT